MQSEEMRDGVTNRVTDIKRGRPAGMRHANGLIRILIAIVVRERAAFFFFFFACVLNFQY